MNAYIIAGVASFLLLAGFGGGFYVGHLKGSEAADASKTALETQDAAQLQAAVTEMAEHDAAAAAQHAKDQGVIDNYDAQKNVPDPSTVGLAQRLRNAEAALAATASHCPVPTGGVVAGGTQSTGAQPGGDSVSERLSGLTQAVFTACTDDAKQLDAMVKIAP